MADRMYLGKWDDLIHLPKYQKIRDKIMEAFKDITFDEGPHKYYLNGVEIECVSNVTHMFKEPFDRERMANETYERNFDNPESKYYKMTPDQILEQWDKISSDACEHGTQRHEFSEGIQHFILHDFDKIPEEFKDRVKTDEDGRVYYEAIYPKEKAAIDFYNDMPRSFVPILAECRVYREDLKYSGTFDLLCYYDAELDGLPAEKSGLVVLDWKTNKDLYKNFKEKKLLQPFDFLLDRPLSLYALQLSLYQLALEKIGLKVIARRLMWLLPTGTYNKIPLDYYGKELEEALREKIENGTF